MTDVQDKKEWAQHPITKAFLQNLKGSREETKEAWACEVFAEGALQNATALGGMRVLTELISLIESYDEVEEVGGVE